MRTGDAENVTKNRSWKFGIKKQSFFDSFYVFENNHNKLAEKLTLRLMIKLFSANEIIGIKTPLVPTLLRCPPDFSNNMGEGRSGISLFGSVYVKNMTSAKDTKKDLSFLTGLSSSTWLRYPRTRGLTKHHKAKITILFELIKNEIQRV
jgi:hypothetical protein